VTLNPSPERDLPGESEHYLGDEENQGPNAEGSERRATSTVPPQSRNDGRYQAERSSQSKPGGGNRIEDYM
jgi:hypothetical protein